MAVETREEYKASVKEATTNYMKEFLTDLGLTEQAQQMQIDAVVNAAMNRYDEEQRCPREKYRCRLQQALSHYVAADLFPEKVLAFYGIEELRDKLEQHFMDIYDSVYKEG